MAIIEPTPAMACLVALGILVTAVNILTLVIILASRTQRMELHVYPLVSHQIANILIGAFALPTYGLKRITFESQALQSFLCDTWRFMYFISIHLSMVSLILLTANKVLALRYPLHHIRMVTKRRMILSIVLCWAVVIAFDSAPFFPVGTIDDEQCHYVPGQTWAIIMNVFTMCLPLPFIVISYVYMIKLAVAHTRWASKQQSIQTRRKISTARLTVQVQATRKVLYIVGSYLLFWGLSTVYYLLVWLCPSCFPENFEPHDTWLRFFAKLLVMSHALVSAVLYCWGSKFFRKDAASFFSRIGRKISSLTAVQSASSDVIRATGRSYSIAEDTQVQKHSKTGRPLEESFEVIAEPKKESTMSITEHESTKSEVSSFKEEFKK